MAKLGVSRMVGVNGTEFARLHNELEKDLCDIFGIVAGQDVELPIFGAVNADGSIDSMRFTQKSDLSVDGSVGIEFYDNRRRCRLSFAGGRLRTFSRVNNAWVELFDIEDAPEPALTDKTDVQTTGVGGVVKNEANNGRIIGVTSTQPWKFRLYPGTYLGSGAESMPDMTDVDDHIQYFANYCLGAGGTEDEPVLVMLPLPEDRATWARFKNEGKTIIGDAVIDKWVVDDYANWVGSGISVNNSYFLDPLPWTQGKQAAFFKLGVGAFIVRLYASITTMRTFGGALYLKANPYDLSPGCVVNPDLRQSVRFGESSFYIHKDGVYVLNGPEFHVINRQYDSEFFISGLCNAPEGGVFNLFLEIIRMN